MAFDKGHWAFVLICLLLIIVSGCNREKDVEVKVGNVAPDFSLTSLEGTTVTNRSYKGQIVVLNFWATWCQPCLKEIPELVELATSKKVQVVGIALDQDGLEKVKPFAKRQGINYTVLIGNERVFQRFKGFGIPYSLVLDRDQRIVNVYRGPTTKTSIEQDIKGIS